MHCPNCGKEVKKDVTFCKYCGYNLVKQEEPSVLVEKKKGIRPLFGVISMIVVTVILTAVIVSFVFNHTPADKVTIKGSIAVPSAAKGTRLSELPPHDSIVPSAINKDTLGDTFTALGLPQVASASSSRRTPKCDPFPCKPVSNAPVRIVKSSPLGWKAEPTVSGTTDSNGDYSITADKSALTSEGPVFVAAIDVDGTTLMSIIPADLIMTGATLELAIDRTTTAAAVMHCPGGVYPSSGTGGYCYSDPKESTNVERLYAKIDLFFAGNPSTTTNLGEYLSAVLNDPEVLEALNQLLSENNLPEVSATNPEGVNPINLNNAHALEDLGRVFSEPVATTPQPIVTTPPTTTRKFDLSTGGRLVTYPGWYQDSEAFKRNQQIVMSDPYSHMLSNGIEALALKRDYSLSGVRLDVTEKSQQAEWCWPANVNSSVRGTCRNAVWFLDNSNFPQNSYCFGSIDAGGYEYDPTKKETVFQLSVQIECLDAAGVQDIKVISTEKSGGGLTASFTASYQYDAHDAGYATGRIVQGQLPTMTLKISPLRELTKQELQEIGLVTK